MYTKCLDHSVMVDVVDIWGITIITSYDVDSRIRILMSAGSYGYHLSFVYNIGERRTKTVYLSWLAILANQFFPVGTWYHHDASSEDILSCEFKLCFRVFCFVHDRNNNSHI